VSYDFSKSDIKLDTCLEAKQKVTDQWKRKKHWEERLCDSQEGFFSWALPQAVASSTQSHEPE
jgi:hypothetical protein